MFQDITPEFVRQALHYDELSGIFTWKLRPACHFNSARAQKIYNTKYPGRTAGYVNNAGYIAIFISGKKYLAHRIAWLYSYGKWPKYEIDHINGDKSDNKLSNLRDVIHLNNSRNTKMPSHNTSGIVGVYWHKAANKWTAGICVNQKSIHLGLFEDKNDAIIARLEAEKKYNFHANHGRGGG